MLSAKYNSLIKQLIEKTECGKAKWNPTSQYGRFELPVGTEIISIYSSVDEQPEFWVVPGEKTTAELLIMDKGGRTVDSLKAYDKGDLYNDLMPLYRCAKSSALNIDSTIDTIISRLEQL